MSKYRVFGQPVIAMAVLPDGTEQPQAVVQEFFREVTDSVQWLHPDATCGVGSLVTPKFWLPKSRYERAQLGRFLAYWVTHGEVELEFASPPGRSPKRYRRRR